MKFYFTLTLALFSGFLFSSNFKIAIGGTGNEYGMHTVETSDKGFLIAGYTSGGTAVGDDGLIIKLDQNGNVLWSKIISNSGTDRFYGCIEMDSNYYAVGYTTSASTGGQDGWCVKLDNTGTIQWSKKFGGTSDDGLYKLAVLGGNRLAICGYSGGTGEQYAYLYLVKMDENGNAFWEQKYGSGIASTQTNSARNIVLDTNGDLLLSGYTYCFGAGLHDAVVVSVDTATGTRNWTKSYGGFDNDGFNGVINTNDGNAICSGGARIDGTSTAKYWVVKINLNGDTLWQKSYYQTTSTSNYAGFIANAENNGFISVLNEASTSGAVLTNIMRLDSVGIPLWARTFNGINFELFNAVLTTSDTNYVAMGQTNSFGAGGYDIFFVKLDKNGNMDTCCIKTGTILTKTSNPSTATETQNTVPNTSTTNYSNVDANFNPSVFVSCIPIIAPAVSNVTICSGNTYPLPGGGSSGTSGTYSGNYTSFNGCDSSIILNLTVLPASITNFTGTVCAGKTYPLPWPPNTPVSTPGVYYDSLTNQFGCDSILVFTLTVTPAPITTLSASVCKGKTYPLPWPPNTPVGASGAYTTTITTSTGCDSVVILNLTVTPAPTVNVSASICAGDSYTLPNGSVVTTGGIYNNTISVAGACDTIISVNLAVIPAVISSQNVTICAGSTYALPCGNPTGVAGVYPCSLIAQNGCDSIVTIILSVTPAPTANQDPDVCEGEGFVLPTGAIANTSGTYTDTVNVGGCDSIVVTNLTVRPSTSNLIIPNVFTPNSDGKNDIFELNGTSDCIEKFTIIVYNRWGLKIFESNKITVEWDGRISNGIKADDGTYFYIIKIETTSGEETQKSGFVTLLR